MTEAKYHIPALDGLRGMAALGVFAAHIEEQRVAATHGLHFLGPLGVSLFFTLSGFLMAFLYLGKSFNRASVEAYGLSRASRILPLYLLVIVCSYGICKYIDPDFVYQINDGNVLRHLLLSGNVFLFWTIPPEVQFYVFFLAVWWALDRWRQDHRVPLLAVSAAVIVMLFVGKHVPGTTLPSKLHLFILGVVAGVMRVRWVSPILTQRGLAFAQGALIFALVANSSYLIQQNLTVGYTHPFLDEAIYFSALNCLICGALIFVFSYNSRLGFVLFGNSFMRKLGEWSFAFYLLHGAVLQIFARMIHAGDVNKWLGVVCALAVSLLLAATAHQAYERPSQRFIKRVEGDLAFRMSK